MSHCEAVKRRVRINHLDVPSPVPSRFSTIMPEQPSKPKELKKPDDSASTASDSSSTTSDTRSSQLSMSQNGGEGSTSTRQTGTSHDPDAMDIDFGNMTVDENLPKIVVEDTDGDVMMG